MVTLEVSEKVRKILDSTESIQRNFQIAYDNKSKMFYVESFITLVLGEDGAYREEE